jgi:flagellar P-ring protein precursor FlgI
MNIKDFYSTRVFVVVFTLLFTSLVSAATERSVRIKDLARLASLEEQSIVGYGVVTGLAGTGDSTRNSATMQSIKNMLMRFGLNVSTEDIRSRNAAAVMVTATLSPYSQTGDKIDVNVTSLGDARSLVGGTLMMTPLALPNREIYALAQGPLSVGGYSYDLNGNLIQQNHPTAAHIPDGAKVNRDIESVLAEGGSVEYKLFDPDFETANRIVDALNKQFGEVAIAANAAKIEIQVPKEQQAHLVRFLTLVEKTKVVPDSRARVIVNERTGTVVSGGDVVISPITISHGNLNVAISTEYSVSQPFNNSIVVDSSVNATTQVVPKTTIDVVEQKPMTLSLPEGAKVVDLVSALNKVRATSRDTITILQSIKRAGALHAELVIQ